MAARGHGRNTRAWEQKASVGVSECKGLPGASADTRQRSQHQLSQTQTLISPPSTTQLTQGASKEKESPRHLNQELSPGVQCPQKGSSSAAGVMFISSEGLVSHL